MQFCLAIFACFFCMFEFLDRKGCLEMMRACNLRHAMTPLHIISNKRGRKKKERKKEEREGEREREREGGGLLK